MESPQPLTIDQSPFDKELNKDLEDSSAHPSELIDELLVNSPSQISITDAVLHEENQMTDNLDLDLNIDLEEIALAAFSSRDRGLGKHVVKPRRLYEMDRNDCKAGEVRIRAQLACSSKAGRKGAMI
jgi:hypothetical protein